jgi:hypothetical protein
MRAIHLLAAAVAAVSLVPASASAAVVIVAAQGNSSTGGVGKASGLTLAVGQNFRVRSNTNDLWSAGALPRWSDGSGLTGNRNAVAGDDSGQAPGTLIGQSFGTWTQDGHTAAFGSLVGRFADGTYQTLGANFTGGAAGSGALELYYWDSNFGDNSGDISFTLSPGVPEPATWAMMILGFGLIGGTMRHAKVRRSPLIQIS